MLVIFLPNFNLGKDFIESQCNLKMRFLYKTFSKAAIGAVVVCLHFSVKLCVKA